VLQSDLVPLLTAVSKAPRRRVPGGAQCDALVRASQRLGVQCGEWARVLVGIERIVTSALSLDSVAQVGVVCEDAM
jgi:hypothetical protein